MDNLKSLIIQQIKQVYGPLKVYDEPIRQGLDTPAFLVLIYHDEQDRQLRHRIKRDFEINVTYFPENEREFHAECDAVSEMFKARFRRLANRYHINRLEAVKSDGVLVVTFNIRAILEEIFDETKMGNLEVRFDGKTD